MTAPVLNERSVEPIAAPPAERLESLVAVLRKLDSLGFSRVLRHTRDALDREITAGISLRDWLLRHAAREIRQYLGGRLSKAPFVEQLHEQHEGERGVLWDVSYDGTAAPGLGIAYFLDAPAVSLRGAVQWGADPLILLLTIMDAEGVAEELRVEVIHLSLAEQVDARATLLRDRLLRAVVNGDDLWRRRLDLFARLDFCEGAERQLKALSGNEIHFQHVVLALSRLNAALLEWVSGPLYPGMSSSAESEATLKHGSYGPMRDFSCPDNRTRRFSNHIKLFASNWRIYYWETRSGGHGRAFIGYVGAHLPTVKYRT